MTADENVQRRRFLKTAAAGGVAGVSALAGCSGDGGDGDGNGDTDTDMNGGGGGDTDTGGGEMGEQLPTYAYMNNPANYNPARHDAINLIGSQLNELGMDVEVDVFEWGTLYTKVTEEQDFSFTTWNRGLGIYPGRRMPEMFHSSNTDPGNGNFTGYTNEDLDPVLSEQMQVTDNDERVDMLFQIQETISQDVPMHPIVQMPNLLAYNSDQVSGWIDHISGYYHFEPQTNVEVNNEDNVLRGSWSETLGTLNVMGYNNETKLIHQFEMLYDKLVRINSNLEPDSSMSLATEWERPDEQTARYKIREGHTWHDGEDVTPEDVKFTLDYIQEYEIPLYATQLGMYDSSSVDGDWVTVNFSSPVGPVHTLFSNQIPIIPQHIWESRNDPNNMSVEAPVGSGPLEFDYWDQGSELSLVKNEDHWNTVNYDRRIWRIIPESSTVWSLLKSGDLNYLPFSRIGKQLNDNQDEDMVGVQISSGDGWWHFSQNTRLEGLDDKAVRQANVWALPKTAITQQLLYDFPKEGWNLIGESFGQYSNPDVKRYTTDEGSGMEEAKQTLRDAGYVFDDDGNVHFPAE